MIRAAAAAFAALVLLVVLLMAAVTGLVGRLFGGTAAAAPAAVAGIPPAYLTLYTAAAGTCPGLHWSVLAAIGKVETDHGRSNLPGVHSGANAAAGAKGPMQFLQPTFDAVTAAHPPPPGGANPPSPYNPHDAIHTAAMYLCDNGARDGIDLPGAIFTYNRSTAYVDQVLAAARDYATTAPTPAGAAADIAIGYALSQLGQPYVWGGNGPDAGQAGFDCSGLVKAAYGAAGIQLPRVAADQYRTGPAVPADQPLAPGDLVFYGTTATNIHHVALYIGDGQMVTAPQRGERVKIAAYRYPGDDYYGASRPSAHGAPSAPAPPTVMGRPGDLSPIARAAPDGVP